MVFGRDLRRTFDRFGLVVFAVSSVVTAAGTVPAARFISNRPCSYDCDSIPMVPVFGAAVWMIVGLAGILLVWLMSDLSVQPPDSAATIRIAATGIAFFNAIPALLVDHWIAKVASVIAIVAASIHGSLAIIE